MTNKYLHSNKWPTVTETGKEDALLTCDYGFLKIGVL